MGKSFSSCSFAGEQAGNRRGEARTGTPLRAAGAQLSPGAGGLRALPGPHPASQTSHRARDSLCHRAQSPAREEGEESPAEPGGISAGRSFIPTSLLPTPLLIPSGG